MNFTLFIPIIVLLFVWSYVFVWCYMRTNPFGDDAGFSDIATAFFESVAYMIALIFALAIIAFVGYGIYLSFTDHLIK